MFAMIRDADLWQVGWTHGEAVECDGWMAGDGYGARLLQHTPGPTKRRLGLDRLVVQMSMFGIGRGP